MNKQINDDRSYETYYNNGIVAWRDNNISLAKENILKALDVVLEKATHSNGVDKVNCIKKSQELYELLLKLKKIEVL